MSPSLDSPAVNAWIFSERCQGCESVVSAAFCNDEFCRRKFVLAGDRTHLFCPIHDTALAPERVPETMKGAVRCPTCQRNLYGVKAEDRR
jgi:hypothetical protein